MYDFAMYILLEIEYQLDIRDQCVTLYDKEWKESHIRLLESLIKPLR